MKTIVFDIKGDWGHFRKPYAPVSPVTFPLPPPPTVLGMIGAICGYGKDEYAERIGWDRVKIAVSLKAPVKRYRTALNLVNTKSNKFFRLVGEASRSQIPYEFLKSPSYRIFVTDASDDTMDDLERFLRSDTTVYTPSLGLAQCIASVSFVGIYQAEQLPLGKLKVSSAIPLALGQVYYDEGGRYTRFRIPHLMRPDRTVEKYSEVLVEETAQPITVETSHAFRVNDENVLFF
ncbi:MAG: type I-B CRISPR-associated protein Cas5b [Proteobacteria bacterium]|nr:type I-B CRISPR-associated protein Cas5b [Pseudomonadota bacterium]MBU1714413.1 type I-B CRISPR-associated protein Cas5b [Pseudomonadota bacterium]